MGPAKPQSGRVAASLIARCDLRLTALRRGGRAHVLRKAHDLWIADARALWLDMTPADQQRVKDARLELEAAFAVAAAPREQK